MANDAEGVEKSVARAAVGRGPSYPALTVEEAIAKAAQFWSAEKRGAAPVGVAARHWGYSETSSSGKMVVAALIHFGLFGDQGAKDSRMVKLTGRALDIVLDAPESPKRLHAIQDAVWEPKIYSDILAKWGPSELPSDQTLRFYLLREKSFNDGSVDSFIKDFRASVAFAKFAEPEDIPQPSPADDVELEPQNDVESNATNPFLRTVATTLPPAPTSNPVHQSIPCVVGEREWLRGPLGKSVGYRLIVSGEMGGREIGKLIKLLEAQKAVLDDEDLD